MTLDALPAEILSTIAGHIAQDESDRNTAKEPAMGICFFTDDNDEHHSTTNAALSNFLLARSPSFWNFASVSRQIRDVLFDSRESWCIKVNYDGRDCQKIQGIPTSVLAKVRQLRLVCSNLESNGDQEPDISSLLFTPATIFRGIGDILLPYHQLQRLEIDWTILSNTDPRIKAMKDLANATPVMTSDFPFPRPCTLPTVVNLHINLGTTHYLAEQSEREQVAQQLDLILQQFDLPALRNFHLSYEAEVPVASLEEHWSGILSVIHCDRWPCLQTARICVGARYQLESFCRGANKPVWHRLVRWILTHLETSGETIKVDINILWRLPSFGLAFVKTAEGRAMFFAPIMPTPQKITDFLNGLPDLAKTRTFALQIYGKFDCQETEFVRLLRTSYEPAVENAAETPGAPVGNGTSITYEVEQDAMEEVLANITSENERMVTSSTFGIQVPVDKQRREDSQMHHGSQQDEVDWNQETETENESGYYQNDERAAIPQSSAWRGSVGESDADDEDEGNPDAMDMDESDESVHGLTDDPITPVLPSGRFRFPGGNDNHDAWSLQHGVERNSAVWAGVLDNEIDPLDGGGREMSGYRGDARLEYRTPRYIDLPEETEEAFINAGLGRNGDGDSGDQSDGESAEEDDVPRCATVWETEDEDWMEGREDAQRVPGVAETDVDEELTIVLGGVTLGQ